MAGQLEVPLAGIQNEDGSVMVNNRFNIAAGGQVHINARNNKQDDDIMLRSLPYVSGAKYSSYLASDGTLTRVALLDRIMAWSTAHDARHVFWLSGIAGTGKSTIARTVASRCADAKRLGGSFFFVRGGGDLASADKFVTTVAVQLAEALPVVKPLICKAARTLRDVGATPLQEQWSRLVLQPLAETRGGLWQLLKRQPVVIVVDALDECNSERETAALLGLLALSATAKESRWLRVLLTSRPETRIRYKIQSIPNLDRLFLHEVDPPIIDHDISIYFNDDLRRVGDEFLHDPDWPSVRCVDALVARAGGLFIWAATAYRFIALGEAIADNRLQDILGRVNDASAPEQSLDNIYLTVLDRALSNNYLEREQMGLYEAVYAVLKTIVVLAAPVDRHTLANLAEVSNASVNRAILGLQSILAIPEDTAQLIRLHHASFRDFVMDLYRCSDVRFSVDGKEQHKILAERCVRLMAEHLRKDICDARAPDIHVSQVRGCTIEDRLPPWLQYSCRYWVHHVRQADELIQDLIVISDFLFVHLLHWLEALSLLRKAPEAVHMLRDLEMLTARWPGTDLHALVSDAKRFVLSCLGMATEFPLQVYSPTLVFAPSRSLVRQLFLLEILPWISHVPQERSDRNARVLAIETRLHASKSNSEYNHGITMLAFSPDGQTLAVCSSQNGLSLWDSATGASRGTITIKVLQGCAYSQGGRFLAYHGLDGDVDYKRTVVGLWDVELQTIHHLYDCNVRAYEEQTPATLASNGELFAYAYPSGSIMARIGVIVVATSSMAVLRKIDTRLPYEPHLTFSPDGQLLAVARGDGMDIYGVHDDRRFPLDNAAGGLFSPGADLYAYTSHDHSVHLWSAEENGRHTTLVGHQSRITGMVFSPNGRLLASVCSNQCIVWEVGSEARLYSLPNMGMTRRPQTISPDSRLLAWFTSSSRVCLWPAEGGDLLGTIDTASMCLSMAFAPDVRLFACLTDKCVIEVWDVNKLLASSHNHSQLVSCITTSSDGKLFALSIHGGSVRVMAKENNAFCLLLTTISSQATSLMFSPNNQRLAIRSDDKTVEVVDVPGGNCVLTLHDRDSLGRRLAFSHNSRFLAFSKGERHMAVYDFRTKAPIDIKCTANLEAIAFHRDEQHLAAASLTKVEVFKAPNWKLCKNCRLSAAVVAFSPDGRLLASLQSTTLKLLDVPSLAINTVFNSLDVSRQMKFSLDGCRLLTDLGELSVPEDGAAEPASQAGTLVSFDKKGEWISCKARNLLWVPPECREPHKHTMHQHGFAWVDAYGDVQNIEFDPSLVTEAGDMRP